MTIEQVVSFSIYVIGAFVLSLGGVLAFGVAMEGETRFRRLMVPALYLLIIVTGCVTVILSGRNVSVAGVDISSIALPPTLLSKWIPRLAVLTALTVCMARVLAALFSRENRSKGGSALFVAFLFFFLTNYVFNSALGMEPEFTHGQYYALLFFTAVFASRTQDPETAIRFLKWGLAIFMAASLVVSHVAPDLAIQRNYSGWLPGITIRFWGLGLNPNSTGPLALLYLLIAIHQPFERRWSQYLGLSMAILVLILTQSKTAWVAAMVAVPLLHLLRSSYAKRSDDTPPVRSSSAMSLTATSTLSLGVVGVFVLLVLPQLGVSIYGGVGAMLGDDVSTLHGRDVIWALAVEEWARNPLFGYGVTIWDAAYRAQIGMLHAYSAHNQFFQSLSAAGLFGVIGLVIYLAILSRNAISARHKTRGLSVALLVFVLARCVTEAPLEVGAFLIGEFPAHLLLFHLALVHGNRVTSSRRPASPALSPGRSS